MGYVWGYGVQNREFQGGEEREVILQNMHMGVPDWEKSRVVSSMAVFCTDRGLIVGFLLKKGKEEERKKLKKKKKFI